MAHVILAVDQASVVTEFANPQLDMPSVIEIDDSDPRLLAFRVGQIAALRLQTIIQFIKNSSIKGATFVIDNVVRPVITDAQGIAYINAEITAILINTRVDGELFFFADSPIGIGLTNVQMTALAIAARTFVKKCVAAGNEVILAFSQLTTEADITNFDYQTLFATKFSAQ